MVNHYLVKWTIALCKACGLSLPMVILCLVIFRIGLNFCYANIEIVFYGERFPHRVDVLTDIAFAAYAVYATWICGLLAELKDRKNA